MTQTAARDRTILWLRVVAGLCALSSLGALITHVFGLMPMVYFLTFFGVPCTVFILALAALARRIDATIFLTSLTIGIAGGFVATLGYDGFRLVIREMHLFDYDGFKAIYIFGGWITGTPETTAAAAAGWFYHFWNGISFGVFYTLTFGARHWLHGAAYGLVMEAMMLGLFPFFLQITDQVGFIVVSMSGHLVYGVVLGVIAQRYARNW